MVLKGPSERCPTLPGWPQPAVLKWRWFAPRLDRLPKLCSMCGADPGEHRRAHWWAGERRHPAAWPANYW